MHPALEISEIVHLVVAEFQPDTESFQSPDSKVLAILARTCTTFHDIALDALWSHQTTILNLVRCMPQDLWETVEVKQIPTMCLRRAPTASDWDRALKYAYRVKSLLCRNFQPYDNVREPDLICVYEILRQGVPGGLLLPKLQHLSWYHHHSPHCSFIDLFLGTWTTSLCVCTYASDPCPVLFAALGQRSAMLVSVILLGVPDQSADLNQTQRNTFIRTLTQVEALNARPIDSETLGFLGRLNTLQTLRTILPPTNPSPAIPEGSLFPNLREAEIEVDGGNFSALVALVRTWNNPPTKSVEFGIGGCGELQQVQDLYEALATHCIHDKLRMLTMRVYRGDDMNILFAHSAHSFRPLFCFTELRDVEILVPGGHDLDDETISAMARAWPHIKRLVLRCSRRSTYYNEHPPRCTLLALDLLAQHCPHLKQLAMTLNASKPPRQLAARQVAQDKLTQLDVGFSPISDVSTVATFIKSIFSSLMEIGSDMVGEPRQRWTDVEDFVLGRNEN
ncbi:hypothetical protein K438DRAFT_2021083 [Mycena galopus ATCC 62051]|nr:hypothetical protein K438DRAFT_2021083 [Mycena galopus ATCC 62051]